jgi:hypothetical protein
MRRVEPRPVARSTSVSRGVTKRPCGSVVGRLLDSSTKKSQTLNRFRQDAKRKRCVRTDRNEDDVAGVRCRRRVPIPHASLFARAKQSGMDRSLDEIPVDTIGVVLVIRQSPADDLRYLGKGRRR